MHKENLKNKAVQLRKEGNTYSEILKKIPVAKSTLSLWLRSVNLSKKQKQNLTIKKMQAAMRGGEAKKRKRIENSKKIINQAKMEIGEITDREAWLAGTMLYWAEGSKQKETNISVGVMFSNSDPAMIKFFVKWLKKYLRVTDQDIILEIYIHENFKAKKDQFIKFWSDELGLPIEKFDRVYFKKNVVKTKRKNISGKYHGQINVKVRKSSNFNRKIQGWIEGFNQ